MRIVVSGGWSYGNIGDEAIAKTTIFQLSRFGNNEIIFTSFSSEEFKKHHGIESVESAHRILENNPDIFRFIDKPEDVFEKDIPDAFKYYERLFDDTTVFVMSGGGYFLDIWKEQFIARLYEIEIARRKGAKIMLIGQSIGPFIADDSRRAIRRILKSCSFISVRDESSKTLLKEIVPEININLSCDIANCISSCFHVSKAKNEVKSIGVMLSGYVHYQKCNGRKKTNGIITKIMNRVTFRKYYFEIKLKRLIHLIAQNPDVHLKFLLSTDWKHDIELTKRITKSLPNSKYSIRTGLTIDELCSEISLCKSMISCKMHPLIIANAFGVNTYGISYNFKMDDFMSSIGRGDFCIKNNKFFPNSFASKIESDTNYFDFVDLSSVVDNEFVNMMSLVSKNE